MARFTDIDKLDNEPSEKKSGVRFTDIDALDDTPKQAEKPSLYQRAKSLFTSDKSKAMTVQQGEVSPQPVQAQPKQMTVTPQTAKEPPPVESVVKSKQMTAQPQEGILSKAARIITEGIDASSAALNAESEMMSSPGAAEAMASTASGLASWIPAGLSMTPITISKEGVKLRKPSEMAKTAKDIQETLTYEPKSEEGKAVAAGLAYPISKVAELGNASRDVWYNMADESVTKGDKKTAELYRVFGLIAGAGGESLPFLSPGVRGLKKGIAESTWFRKLTNKERGLTYKNIADAVDSGEINVADIREQWKDKKNREALLKKYAGVEDKEKPTAPEESIIDKQRKEKPQFTDDFDAETHDELIEKESIKPKDVEEKGFVISDDKLIPAVKTAEGEIVDAEGKKGGDFLSRTQAKNHLKENKSDIHNALAAKLGDDYELHSQDLKKAESLVKAESIAKSIDEIAPEQPKAPEIEAIDKGIKPVDEAKSEVQANLLPVDIKPTTITPDVSAEAKEDIPDKSQEEAKPILPAKKAKSDVYKVSLEVKEVPVDQITLSRDVPQFKSNASDKGIVEPLSGAYDRLPTNPIVLWQRENGALEIITGRHRYDLAQRTGEKTIPAQIVKEADGFTTQDALTFDAEQNIKDNQGSDFDYANYFRNTNITEEEAKSRGVLRGEKANTAFLLGKSATDSTFNAYRSGQIKFKQAAAIAKATPGDEALQNEGLRYLLNEGSKSNDLETENYIKAISQFEAVKPADQGDLFGYDDSAIRTAVEMSKKVSKIQNALRKDAANINAAILKSEALQLTPEAMQKYDITDGKDKTQLKEAHQKILADLDKWDKWATNPELVAQLKGEPKGMSVEEGTAGYASKQINSPEFKKWFDDSKVVDDSGKPLVVYSGHSNAEMYGAKFDLKKSTAGGFYASEDPEIASGYALGKFGVKEYYENGGQYRLEGKAGKLNKKLWQYDLTDEQKNKIDELAKLENEYGDKDFHIEDMRRWAKDMERYEPLARRLLARPYDLQNIWAFNEHMGYNIAYAKEGQEPFALRQQKNETEELLDKLGIKWNAYDWSQPGVMPIYLSIKKPLDADKPFPDDLLKALKTAAKYERVKADYDSTHWTSDYPLKLWLQDIESGNEYWTTQIPKKALNILKQHGYDGIKERGNKGADKPREERGINWIAFEPTQIKSAIGNKGSFDPENPNILLEKKKPYGTADLFAGKEAGHDVQSDMFGDEAAKGAVDKIKSQAPKEEAFSEKVKDETEQTSFLDKNGNYDIIKAKKEGLLTNDTIKRIESYGKGDLRSTGRGGVYGAKGEILHASRIPANLTKRGYIDLRGQKVESPRDLAAICQIFRDPQVETLRFFYLKNGVIVGHEGVSSRMPGFVNFFPKGDEAKSVSKMISRAERLGADDIQMLHNHPSGRPEPSPEDIKSTNRMRVKLHDMSMEMDKMPITLSSHVVIDHKKYGVINPMGGEVLDLSEGKEYEKPEKDHELLGTKVSEPSHIAKIGKSIQSPKDYVTLIFRDNKGTVSAIQDVHVGILKGKGAIDYLRGRAREFGAAEVFAHIDSLKDVGGRENIRQLIAKGALRDVTWGDNSALETERMMAKPGMVFGKKGSDYDALRTEEEKPSYGTKKRKWSDVEGLTDAQKEARKRIEKDVKLLSANAEEAGQTLPEYLKAIGLDDAKAKRLLDYANSQPVEPPKTTGVKNAVVDEERAKRGLPPLEKDMTKANKVTLNNAKDAVDSGRIKPRLIAQNMVENPRNFFDEEEEAALFYDRAKLQNEYASAAELREAAEKSGNPKDIYDAEIKLAALELDLANNDKAATIGGTVSARTLQFRTRLIEEDYSLAAMTTQFKKAHGWKEISERQRKEIIDLHSKLEKTRKDFEEEQKKAEKRELADAFDRMKKDKAVRKAVEQKSKSIEEIKAASEARYAKLADQLKKHLASLHMNIDPTGVKIMAMMAKEKFIGGLKDINKIVDDIHETLSSAEPDLTKRDIRDAITKYGKDPKRQTSLQKEYNDALRQGQLLSAYEDALKGEIPSLKKNTKSPRNEKTVELEKKVKEAMRQAGIDFTNQANSEETYLKRAKTYYDNRTKEIKRKIEEEDLAPPLKKTYPIDEELMQKKAAYEGVKKEFRKMVLAEKLRNQPLDEKILRKIVAANRAIIFTSLGIFEKLTFAGAARFAFEPLKSLIGGTLSYVPGIHYFAERAPIEGGGIIANAKGDIKRFSQIIAKQSYRDMWDMLITGENTLSKLDPKNDMYPKGDKLDKILAYPAQTHEAFKTVPKRGGYYYAYEKYVQHSLTNGIDPLNPVVADTIHIAALDYAKRQIFRNKNPITKLWHETMGSIERKLPRAGKYITAEAQVDMPVVGVPTNIGIELYEMATGWMTAPAQMAYYRTFGREAVKNLKPEQFDNIYRALKNGMVGVAIALIGGYLYEQREDAPVKLGGFYVKGEKRKSTDIKADEAKVYDMNVSKNMLHNTYLMFLQGGYTAAKVSDEYRKAMKGSELEALWTGAGATAKGIASTVPFFETPYKMGSAIVNPKRGEKFIAEKVKRVIPPTVQKWAKDHDVDESGEPIPRSPEGVIENILMGIPGLREDVPINTKKQKEDLKSVLTDDLRNKEPGARKNLNQALRQGKITEIEYDNIDKKAREKGSAIAINAKNMNLEELAKRLRKNATPEQRKEALPVLKEKFFGKAGENLPKEKIREYRDLIKEIKDE